jgi:putative ATPase
MQEELFKNSDHEPLAFRMRPNNLDDYQGQSHILSKGKLLRRAIEADMISSLILYGPPGTGKTTLAKIIAKHTKSRFLEINATEGSVSDIKEAANQAKGGLSIGEKTILFIDEIHRFSKAQQDALLPHVENGTLRLIGATTQNPFFSINSPLISRSQIFELKPLNKEEIKTILRKAVNEKLNGASADEGALELLCDRCEGDARRALNALELAFKTSEPVYQKDKGGYFTHITLADAEESIQKKAILYDRDGDSHYDTISAFIKSLRGSDPNAALYWLAKMLEAGEEPRYIARRLVVHAAEDVGLADPSALLTATAAQNAVETIGMPESRIHLSMATLHIALAPKSNSSYKGIDAAIDYIQKNPLLPVPEHLRDTHYEGASSLGRGEGYLYPHNFPWGYVKQSYLPHEDQNIKIYNPSSRGIERDLNLRLEELKKLTENNNYGDQQS